MFELFRIDESVNLKVEPEYMNLNLQESQAREDAAPPK